MTYLGIDEVRRGCPRFTTDPDTAQTTVLADRWHTGFVDLAGEQALLGSVQGRSATAASAWLANQPRAWREGVAVVCLDLCSAFRRAAKRHLPNATICADAFHLVQLANKMVNQVRWRIVRETYDRRTRKGDPEYGIKRLLVSSG